MLFPASMPVMTQGPIRPGESGPPEDVLGGLAAIDRRILELLAQRFALVRNAGIAGADLEDDDMRRKAIADVRRAAFELGVPVGLVGDFWDRLADASAASARQS
jgi:chorismate mutase